MNEHEWWIVEHGADARTLYATCRCGWSSRGTRSLAIARGAAVSHARPQPESDPYND